MEAHDSQYLAIPVSELRLDWANPRLPVEEHDPERPQDELAVIMDRRYNALAVAQSIAKHGFFTSEPLIAMRDRSSYRVLEGNRRLTALKGLSNPSLRERLAKENRGWGRLDTSNAPQTVPVVVVDREEDVDALLGFRHISGIDPWSPYQQAQFIHKLVEQRQLPLNEVAELVGRPLTEVRSMYRDFDILRYASENGLDSQRATKSFGVFTLAMGRPILRSHIGAEDPRNVDPGFEPIPEQKLPALEELMGFLFGTHTEAKVITDSRQVRDLVAIFEDQTGTGLRELRSSRDLSEALSAIGQPDAPVTRALSLSLRHARRALDYHEDEISDEAKHLIAEIRQTLSSLSAE